MLGSLLEGSGLLFYTARTSHLGEAALKLLSRLCLFQGIVAPGDKKLTPTYFDLSHYG